MATFSHVIVQLCAVMFPRVLSVLSILQRVCVLFSASTRLLTLVVVGERRSVLCYCTFCLRNGLHYWALVSNNPLPWEHSRYVCTKYTIFCSPFFMALHFWFPQSNPHLFSGWKFPPSTRKYWSSASLFARLCILNFGSIYKLSFPIDVSFWVHYLSVWSVVHCHFQTRTCILMHERDFRFSVLNLLAVSCFGEFPDFLVEIPQSMKRPTPLKI